MTKVDVTQADRDAAAAFLREDRNPNSPSAHLIKTGGWDAAAIVQAFARHRRAALEEAAAIADMHDHRGDIGTAIRALAHQGER